MRKAIYRSTRSPRGFFKAPLIKFLMWDDTVWCIKRSRVHWLVIHCWRFEILIG